VVVLLVKVGGKRSENGKIVEKQHHAKRGS